MSAGIVIHFFPDLTRFLQQKLPDVWYYIFPTATQQQCPEHEFTIGHARIRNGTLLPVMLLSALVGLMGFFRMAGKRSPAPLSAAFSHLFFGLMNTAAIVCHSFTEPRSSAWEVAAALDACCTASAALLACAAFCLQRQVLAGLAAHVTIPASVFAGCSVGLVLALPFVREVVYLFLTLSAAAAVGVAVAARFRAGTGSRGLAVACLGVGMAVSGLALDRHLCGWFGNVLNHMHPLFLGCLLIFGGLEAHFMCEPATNKED